MHLSKNIRAAFLAFLFLAAGYLGHHYLTLVSALGHFVPQEHMGRDYVVGLLWALALGVSILAWPVPSRHKPYLALLWLAKVLVTLVFMLFYENHYQLDEYGYFAAATSRYFFWQGFVLGQGTQNIIHLARLHNELIPNSFHAMKVSCAMIGLWGVYCFYRGAAILMQQDNLKALLLLGLFPSILFWSSILGKDPIVFLGISLYVLGAAGLYQYRQFRYVIVLALGVLLAMFIRIWLGPILLAPLIAFILLGIRSPLLKVLIAVIAIATFLLATSQFFGQFNIESNQDLVARTDSLSQSWAQGGSGQVIQSGLGSISSMLIFSPKGAFTALFRPLPGEVLNPFGLLSSMENLYLLGLFGLAVARSRFSDLKEPPVTWAAILVLCWAFIYGFISYQNLGSAVRFKLQIIPIFLCLLMYLARRRSAQEQQLEGGFESTSLRSS